MNRNLSDRLKKYLDEQLSIVIVNPLSCFLEAAHVCAKDQIREEGGDNRGPMVEAFQATVGGANGESWCLSFVQALIAYTEDRYGLICDLPITEHVATFWAQSPSELRFKYDPMPGDIVCWRYGDTDKGHCGIVTRAGLETPRALETIEGNTSAQVAEIDREGNGVFSRIRARKGTSTMHLVGFVRPRFISKEANVWKVQGS